MKIQTNSKVNINRTVKFAQNIKVTFNNNGVAEVPDREGKFLLERYPEQLTLEGVIPAAPAVSKAMTAKDTTMVEDYKERIQELNRVMEGLKQEARQAKEGEEIWRTKCNELLDEISLLKGHVVPDVSAPAKPAKTEATAPDTAVDIKKTLSAKKIDELRKIAESLSLPKEEWEFLNRFKLVDYLVEKSK